MKNLFKRELNLHKQWLEGKPNGKQADFSSECLRGVDFSGCDLRQAIQFYMSRELAVQSR